MKKWIGMVTLLATGIVQAVTLSTSFNTQTTPSYDPDGTSLGSSVGFGWVVQLMEYYGGYASFDGGSVLASTTLGPNSSIPFKTFNISTDVGDSAINVYVRIFNDTTVDAADYYVNLGINGGADFYTTAAGSASVPDSFSCEGFSGTTTDTSARETWIEVVPEPATAGLLGISAFGLWLFRRAKKYYSI